MICQKGKARSSGATLERAVDAGQIRNVGLHFQKDYIMATTSRQISLLTNARFGLWSE